MRLRQTTIKPGWDLVFIARKPIRTVNYHEMDAACARLVRRAQLVCSTNDVSTEVTSNRDASG